MDFNRYALYVTPAPGPLADFGAAWLGWDAHFGQSMPHPDIQDLPQSIEDITGTPRRYGFHATIKPPFRLKTGRSPGELTHELADFCARQRPVTLKGLRLEQLGRFLALVPDGDTDALNSLAASVVRSFDNFRAHPSEAEQQRRRAGGLSETLDANLRNWGYPYVMDAFRLHFTLTGKLPKSQTSAVRTILAPIIDPLLPRPFLIDGLSLMGEDQDGRFHLIDRHPFQRSLSPSFV